MKSYLSNIEIVWYFILIFISIILLVFYNKHKYWCKKNRTLFVLLVISTYICLGNLLPTWNIEFSKYYEYFSDICLAYFTGFIFYFLTNVIKELRVLHLYYFNIAKFYSNYLGIIANSYYREQFSIYKFSGDMLKDFKITIPLEKYKEFFNEDLVEKLSNYEVKYIEEKYQKFDLDIRRLSECMEENQSYSEDDKKSMLKFYKASIKNYQSEEVGKLAYYYQKNLEVEKILKTLYQLLDPYELEKINNTFKRLREWNPLNIQGKELNREELKNKYKYFYKNIPLMYNKDREHLEEALEYLIHYKKYIPGIELKYNSFEYRSLNETLKAKIYLKFYKNTTFKQYYVYLEKNKEKRLLIEKIKKIDGKYIIITENKENFSFKNITFVTLKNKEVELFAEN